ncbi:hypothetical protein AB832_07770 [Flavobacteriaceae bacterium (ex Bugula neritina AB1)]|nr:hypothetical protein AB832_07770 [Flavobacteriaceae bacterium (ex Bugula neritina AB1)]
MNQSLKDLFFDPKSITLGITLVESQFGIQEASSFIDLTLTNFLTSGIELQYLGLQLLKELHPVNYKQKFCEELQEDICNYCEIHILGQSRMSYHFMCEGCSCEEAHEMYIEEVEEQFYS